MSQLTLVCDENVAVTPTLQALDAEIRLLPGRAITREHLRDADALLVRSVTTVNASLVDGTPLRFVGTATAGLDHIDTQALHLRNIAFASAPGSNAIAVVEWVMTVLAADGRLDALHNGSGVGIVGLGQVGLKLAQVLRALGAWVVGYDPLIDDWPEGIARGSLAEVLDQSVVSLHAALHDRPPHASRHMVSLDAWSQPRKGQLLINAGRGPLIARSTLLDLHHRGVGLALDTWPDEPEIDGELLAACDYATPHIAGYSAPAKWRATDGLVAALCDSLALEMPVVATMSPVSGARVLHSTSAAPMAALADMLLAHYPLRRDDAALRQAAHHGSITGTVFDTLRKQYPRRPEFSQCDVQLSASQQALKPILRALEVHFD